MRSPAWRRGFSSFVLSLRELGDWNRDRVRHHPVLGQRDAGVAELDVNDLSGPHRVWARTRRSRRRIRLHREAELVIEQRLAKDAARRMRRAEKQRRRREELTDKQRIDAWVERGYGRRL